MHDLKLYLKDDLMRVAALVEQSLSTDIGLLEKCNRHILAHSGKMVRPMLTLLMARAVSGHSGEDTIRFAAAAELIHNATLLHDDVADDASSRRGAETISSMLGPRPSVLLGDFWLVKGIARILDGEKNSARVMRLFGKTLSDLAEGEMLQLELAGTGATSQEDYLRVIYDKTATLFETSALAGAVSEGASVPQEEAAASFARNLGLAFQIKDDILDYVGGEALGKPAGQDLRERKITLPLLGAMANKPSEESEARARVLKMDVEWLRSFVFENGGIEYASAAVKDRLAKAVAVLDAFRDGPAKGFLVQLADYVGERNY